MNTGNFALDVSLGSQSSKLVDATSGCVYPATGIAQAASMLRRAGLRQGDFLIVCCGIDPTSALVYLGAIYAGVIPIPVAAVDQDRYLPGIIRATNCRYVWTRQASTLHEHSSSAMHVIAGLDTDSFESGEPAATKDTDLAVLMPTSGSTGAPKLVQVSHRNLIANSQAIIKAQGLSSIDRACLILPINYCFGASVLHTHLLVGGDVVFDRRMMFPDKVLDAIDQFQCTTIAAVPSALRTFLRQARFASKPSPSLKKIFQAGGALDRESIQRIRDILPAVELFVMYGQTEATARISILQPTELVRRPSSVGKPIDNVTIRIVSDDGLDCSPGIAGEIWVRGPSVTNGYWNNPESTGSKFSGGWLRTGDLGSLDEEGYLTVSGRRSSFVKVRGLRVALGEIEARAQQLPEVVEAAACSIPHPHFDEAIALFIVLAHDALEVNAINKVREWLPLQWAIDVIVTVDQLPTTSNNKIDRCQLQEMAKLRTARCEAA